MKQEDQQLKAPKQPNDVANKVEMWDGNMSRRMNSEMIKQLLDGERRKVDVLLY